MHLWDLKLIDMSIAKASDDEGSDIKKLEKALINWINSSKTKNINFKQETQIDNNLSMLNVYGSNTKKDDALKTEFEKYYDHHMGSMKFTKFEIFLEQLRLGGSSMLDNQQKGLEAIANKLDNLSVVQIKSKQEMLQKKKLKEPLVGLEGTNPKSSEKLVSAVVTLDNNVTKSSNQNTRTKNPNAEASKNSGKDHLTGFDSILATKKEIESSSLLPYSKNREQIKLPTIFTIPIDNALAFQKIMPIIMKKEAELKEKIINKCISIIFKKFQNKLRQWNIDMRAFIVKYEEKINILRTKFMLNTPPELLEKIIKKDNLVEQMNQVNKLKNPNVKKNKRIGNIQSENNGKIVFQRDHLPFNNLI